MSCVDWITSQTIRIFQLIFMCNDPKKRIRVYTLTACFLLLALTFISNQKPTIFGKERRIHLTDHDNNIGVLTIPRRKHKSISCTSNLKSSVCEVHGDVQIQGNSSSINIYYVTNHNHNNDNMDEPPPPQRIKPYARNQTLLVNVNEVVIQNGRRPSKAGASNPRWCAVNHTVPAIVFSLGMYVGNYYHDFSDVLLPLFLTSHQYDGEVRFLVTNTKSWFIHKYRPLLNLMTNHDILDIDYDDRVHCFSHVIVGLYRYAEFGVIPEPSFMAPQSSSMVDFGKLIRLAFSLERETVTIPSKSKQKPRLLIVSRTGTRKFLNLEEMIKISENLGYTVTITENPESLFEAAKLVNSFDVMLGVHGAGLTSMAFLPMNATVVQVVPWGGIESLARYCFKSATLEFGLRYREYIVGKNESSITEKFSKDDPVFKDPMSIHKQGFSVIRRTYLTQDIRVDVGKMSLLLLDILKTYQI